MIKELNVIEFSTFCKNNPLCNYMQSEDFAKVMQSFHYDYEFIGYVGDRGEISAASLILIKNIYKNLKYGYAPKGFMLNYYDDELMNKFTTQLKEYYAKKNVVFIKINPEIVVGEIESKTLFYESNANSRLKKDIVKYGFRHLKDNLYFESVEPRYNAYIDLKNTQFNDFSKSNRNKVHNSMRKGLYACKVSGDEVKNGLELMKQKPQEYYAKLYDYFNKDDKVDLITIKVDFQKYVLNVQSLYDEEERNNALLNEVLHRSNKQVDLNKKMASDRLLTSLKNELVYATYELKNNNDITVASALVIKDKYRVHVIDSGYDKKYSILNANYFLYNELISMYKKDYDYLDIGAVSGDFRSTNPYYGLNRFKLGYAPSVYEYIGEYDLIIDKNNYEMLLNSGILASVFNKRCE